MEVSDAHGTTHSLIADGIGPVSSPSPTAAPATHIPSSRGRRTQAVASFATLLTSRGARVMARRTRGRREPRPDTLDDSLAGLARVYAALLDRLELEDVTVIGNSIGGWIASELALLGSPRIGSLALVDAAGIEVEGHPIVDFFSLTLDQVAEFGSPALRPVSGRPDDDVRRAASHHGGQPFHPGCLRRRDDGRSDPPRTPAEGCSPNAGHLGRQRPGSSTPTTVAPTRRPFRGRRSSCSPTPGACHSWKLPNSC